jgi:hypothetical protein
VRRALLVLALVAGSLLAAAPADAHTPNPQATWACGATRERASVILTHAHPVDISVTHVTASCFGLSSSPAEVCNWAAILWWNGQTSVASAYHCTLIPS